MFAIAALASCSQNEDTPDNPVFGGQEAKVTLRLKGDAAPSRAVGVAPEAEAEKAIDNLSVFIFNKVTEGLVTKKHFAKAALSGDITIDTKTDGDKVVVIANAAENEVAFNTLFSGVSSLATLRAVKMDLLNNGASAVQRAIKQESGKVLQNGWADIAYGSGDQSNVGNASVHMRFIGARIAVTAISWNGVKSGAFEPNPVTFDADNSKNFTIRAIYLMDANASTRLIPTLAGNTADSPVNPAEGGAVTVNNDYAPLNTRTFGCFEDITAAPWNQTGASQILSDDLGVKYSATLTPTVTGTSGAVQTIATPAWWYVFGNETNTTDGRATALVIKVGWLKGKSGETYPGSDTALGADEREDRYFTVYMDGLDYKGVIQSGKSYGITLKLNGNFLPASGTSGGTGGGGTTDPSTPSLDASVTVTVTTSTWRTVDFEKVWQ